jgi:carbonic anhydrase
MGGLLAASTLTACTDASTDGDEAGALSPSSTATAPGPTVAIAPIDPAEALARLEAGNARFAAGAPTHPHQDVDAREAVAEHQHPWALVHGCVDSRVAPELVFDQGVGDVFTTRTAGAVLDDTIVGSIEFALGAPYEVPLVVVLGHTRCGAVTATVEALTVNPDRPSAPGQVQAIVDQIAPVARRVRTPADPAAHVDAVVRANTRSVARGLVRSSRIVRDAVAAGRTRVVPAVYDLDTGRIGWLPTP